MFKPGKNRDGYFKAENLIAQVDRVMHIFKAKTNSLAQGLFMFNNAPSHLKRADDAISSRKMVKSVFLFFSVAFPYQCAPKIPSASGHMFRTAHACATASI